MEKYYTIHLLEEGCLVSNMTLKYIKNHCNDLVGLTNDKKMIKKMIRDYEEENLDGYGDYVVFEYQGKNIINFEIR